MAVHAGIINVHRNATLTRIEDDIKKKNMTSEECKHRPYYTFSLFINHLF